MIRRVAFLGSKTLGLDVFRCLRQKTQDLDWQVVYPDDRSDQRSNFDDFRQFATAEGVGFHLAKNATSAAEILACLEPDIAFVSGWYWLLKPETLALASHGFYGVHNGLLPGYRGGSPLVWMIINGEAEVGATVFRISEGMDDGDILHTVRVPLSRLDNIGDALSKIRVGLLETLPAVWTELVNERAQLAPQDHSLATYCGQRQPDDGLIDWKQPAFRVHDFIRAQAPPYPGAFTLVNGIMVSVLRSEVDPRRWFGTPGQVLQRSPGGVVVSCSKDTALIVKEAAINGEAMPPASAFGSISLRL